MTVRTSRRETRGWRTKVPVLVVVGACVAALIAAVTGVANPVNATQFLSPGHWVFNVALGTAFHVDGSTAGIDAQVKVPGDDQGSSQVVQGETSGYVVGSSRITEFGKSDLKVVDSKEPPAPEIPAALEAAGGPYLVYRHAGKVVRFGQDRAVTTTAGGPLGDPVATTEGTLWVPRTDTGLLCQLPGDADQLNCPVLLPKGHSGGLTVVDDHVMFVDTTDDVVHEVDADGLGEARPLGVDVPDSARLAANDVSGRIAILDPHGNKIQLIDPAGDGGKRPVTVPLGKGDFEGPVSTGTVVAVVDRKTHTLSTYDADGSRRDAKQVPAEHGGDPRLTRGDDDRVYVDGAAGEHVMVVDDDGKVTDVPVRKASEHNGDRDKKDSDKNKDKDKDNNRHDGTPAGPAGQASPPDTDPRSNAPEQGPPNPGDKDRPPPDSGPDNSPDNGPADDEPPAHHGNPQPPPPVKASPPGVPPSVRATAGNAAATVSWGAAPDNRAAISRYNISWTGGGGRHGSTTAGGGARSAKITGLANGVRYTFTVSATNSAGTGPGAQSNAVTPAAPKPTPKITLSRGAASTSADCSDPANCALMHVVMTGFDPKTTYHLQPHSSDPTYGNPGADLTTDGNGREVADRFAYDSPGKKVWITVATPNGTVTSNKLTWAAGSGGGAASPKITVSRGADSESDACEPPDCAWVHVVMTGFEPNTTYSIHGHTADGHEFTDPVDQTTDANGNATNDDIRADMGGQDVWVTIDTPDGTIESNHYYWEPQ